jgi:hypothetical protein
VIGCAGFDDLLLASGEAGFEPRNPDFLRHLAVCPACLTTFVSYSRASEMARLAYDERDEQPPSLSDASVRQILDAVRADSAVSGPSFDVA